MVKTISILTQIKICLLFFLITLTSNTSAQTVKPSWESINERGYPQWFAEAKLGIFIHWGLYSVPAFGGKESYGEWYYRGIMVGDSTRLNFQEKNYGADFQYEDFDKLWKAELFNADEWATLFKNAGAKYVLLVTKHHDGYCLWDCPFKPDFNSVVGGPNRNIVEEVTNAVRKQNLEMGFYYSLAEWRNKIHTWYVDPPDSIGKYVESYMIPQFKNLVSTYKPTAIFTDGEWLNSSEQWHAKELISWYYNTVGEKAIVNDRWGSGTEHGFRTPEYSEGIAQTDRPWAECRGLGRSFGLNRNEPLSNYLTSKELIKHFVKLVAAGGGMTLNVGPAADGQIPLLQQERLLDLGNWLKINGEAIYGTKPYSKFYEEKKVVVAEVVPNINNYWKRNSPKKTIACDHFTVNWSGFIEAPETATYTFTAIADDFMTMKIENKVVFSNAKSFSSGSESNAEESSKKDPLVGTIFLEKGKRYEIEVLYEEENLEAEAKLFWQYNNADKTIVPENVFFRSKTENNCGLSANYSSLIPYIAYTTKGETLFAICLEFPDEELRLPLPKPSKNAKISLLGGVGELPWKYKNGYLIIDARLIKFSEIKSVGAWVFKINN